MLGRYIDEGRTEFNEWSHRSYFIEYLWTALLCVSLLAQLKVLAILFMQGISNFVNLPCSVVASQPASGFGNFVLQPCQANGRKVLSRSHCMRRTPLGGMVGQKQLVIGVYEIGIMFYDDST